MGRRLARGIDVERRSGTARDDVVVGGLVFGVISVARRELKGGQRVEMGSESAGISSIV